MPADNEAIRIGSPFKVDPPQALATADVKATRSYPLDSDTTPIRYVAMGSVAASTMVLFFAIAAIRWFPVGGAMIAGLGCLLSVLGLYSPHRIKSTMLLAAHLVIFLFCYSQAM